MTLRNATSLLLSVCLLLGASPAASAQSEIPKSFTRVTEAFDHERREVMIPMRDGVKLHAVVVIPKGATDAPIILTRTPYGSDKPTSQSGSPRAAMNLPLADESLLDAGYIRVYQDVRGRYGSQGEYIMNLPLRGELNRRKVDQSTDTYDSIAWLVKNIAGNNGNVGITGVSYPGWLTLMGMIEPHPALKAAVPMYPMVDGWIGDDFYHNGALRQTMFEWLYNMGADKSSAHSVPFGYRDMYELFLSAGSAEAVGRRYGADGLKTWRKIIEHPTYDAFWRGQAVQDILAKHPLTLPVMIVHGLFDQEDNFGGIAAYRALETKDTDNTRVHLVLGPWNHGQSQGEGASLGPLKWNADTSLWFRENVLLPFWNQHLKGIAPAQPLPPVLAFDTGTRQWQSLQRWPADGASIMRPLHLQPGGGLAFATPPAATAGNTGHVEYVSDPAKPVPYRVRPLLAMYDSASTWGQWLVDDQRPFADRTDVQVFVTEPLTRAVRISGPVSATLFASTSGTDSDWVVKLIDVFPPEVRANPVLGGYQLMVSADILRGRYRESLQVPTAAVPGQVVPYKVRMPEANHTFLPGHRIMVQVQSSWFPLYDRNPQTFVPNIAMARPAEFSKATQQVWFTPEQASFVELPVVGTGP